MYMFLYVQVLLTVWTTYWCDCTVSEKTTDWKCIWNRNTKTLYVTYGSRVHVLKYILTGVSSHGKRVLWQYNHAHSQYYHRCKINLETKICGRKWNLSRSKLAYALDLFLIKKTSFLLYIIFCVQSTCHSFSVFLFVCLFVCLFSFDFLGLGLHLRIKWIAKSNFYLDPKIYFDSSFWPWRATKARSSWKPKFTGEIETSGFGQYILEACPGMQPPPLPSSPFTLLVWVQTQWFGNR